MTTAPDIAVAERRRIMRVLARSSGQEIEARMKTLEGLPQSDELRRPETGLVMLRGRIAGSGAPFNLGEVTVTRAAVRLKSGETGFSYTLGRDTNKARNAAVIDALWQNMEWRARVETDIVHPLAQALADAESASTAATAATRVDFFTMVRGED